MKREEEQQKNGSWGWLYGITAGACVAAMQIGVGMLQMEQDYAVILGAAQGLLVCSLTVICGSIMEWLLRPLPAPEGEPGNVLGPVRARVHEYEEAFCSLARSFSSLSGTAGRPAAAGDTQETRGMAAAIQDEAVSAADGKSGTLTADAKAELLWNTRLSENREAMAVQLTEMAQIMTDTVEHAWDTKSDEELEEHLKKRLKAMGLLVQSVLVYCEEHRRQEVYLTMSTRRRRCVAVKDIAAALTKLMGKAMMPSRDSRAFVGNEKVTVLFVERTNFQVLYGAEKAVKGKEQISGDNFSLQHCREGQFIGALSDGMGSGIAAYRESELVIDLLEQFLEAGFSKETAVRMINSALLVRSDAQIFSTIDIASLDLYTGVCEFLKVGASTTFIRRDSWVETISSTSLPAGVFHRLEPDCSSRKLYAGDMVVMVTDGVLDALPAGHQESMMKDIIMEHDTGNPSELAAYILGRIRQYREKEPSDDMTVLVMGLVKY